MQQREKTRRRFAGRARAAAVVATLAAAGPFAGTAGAVPPPDGAEFGISSFATEVKNSASQDETRAGAHPHSARAQIKFDSYDPMLPLGNFVPIDDPRHIITRLPAGFSGNPQATAKCPVSLIAAEARGGFPSVCPTDTWVGFVKLDGAVDVGQPVVSVVPEPGYPAEFGFSEAGMTYTMYAGVRSESDFGVNVESPRSNVDAITDIDVTFCSWGVEMTSQGFVAGTSIFRCREEGEPGAFSKPFLTNPATECPAANPVTELSVDSWG